MVLLRTFVLVRTPRNLALARGKTASTVARRQHRECCRQQQFSGARPHGRPEVMSSSSRLSLALLTGVLAAAPSAAVAQERVDGQYIVVLKSQSSGATVTKAKERARARGGKVQRTYSHVIKGYSAKLSKKA